MELAMELDYIKWKEQIAAVKQLLEKTVCEKNRSYIGQIEMMNREICLVASNFSCQNPKCKRNHKLQMHHLIMREAKSFMDFWRYIHQRYYWGNQVILCEDCHKLYHKMLGQDVNEEMLCITKEKIAEIKNKYLKTDHVTRIQKDCEVELNINKTEDGVIKT